MKRLHKTVIALAAVGLLTTACSDPGGGSDDSGTKSPSDGRPRRPSSTA